MDAFWPILTVTVGILGMLGGTLDGYRRACRRYGKEAVRIPDEIVERLDKKVDKIRYRSRAHLITAILSGWLDENDHPAVGSAKADKKG